MSETHDIINDIVLDRATATTNPVKNLTTGKTFYAEIEGNLDPFTIPDSIGNDPRGKFRLHVTDNAQALEISMQDLVEFTLYGQTQLARIVWRTLDPASPQTKFIAAHVLVKDAR